jgi:hypothetical protein
MNQIASGTETNPSARSNEMIPVVPRAVEEALKDKMIKRSQGF